MNINNNFPTYQTEIHVINNRPISVEITPLIIAGANYPAMQQRFIISNILKRLCIEAVQQTQNWNRIRIQNRVRGFLKASSLVGEACTGEMIHVNEITRDAIEELLERIHQSNLDVQLSELVFEFIFDVNSLVAGHGKKGKPEWLKSKRFAYTWEIYTKGDYPVSCAAVALTTALDNKLKTNKHYEAKTNLSKLIKDSSALQRSFGWGCETSISDLESFVFKYPQFRLVIIQPHFMNNGRRCYQHPTWQPDDDENETLIEKEKRYEQNSIYLFYDFENKHFAYFPYPQQVYKDYKKDSHVRFCHICLTMYWTGPGSAVHNCNRDETFVVKENRKRRKILAEKCKDEHYCAYEKINKILETPNKEKRCPIYVKPLEEKEYEFPSYFDEEALESPEMPEEDEGLAKGREIWIYDIESAVIRNGKTYVGPEFLKEFGDVDVFEQDDMGVNIVRLHQSTHTPNFVAWCKMGTEEVFTSTNLDDMTEFASNHNEGKNIFLAHYASGYDSRLVLKSIRKVQPEQTYINLIVRGTKILRMAVGKKGPIFQDSILHMGQSLRSLTKDFQVETKKGHFPHLFNNGEHTDYEGPIPDKKYFDFRFSFKHKEVCNICEENEPRKCTIEKACDYHDFLDWYETWDNRTDWNFKEQLESYCKDDVKGLAQVCQKYHEIAFDQFKLSPWGFSTAPAYMHHLYLQDNCSQYYIPYKKNAELLIPHLKDFSNAWMVLQAEEAYFARKALRGGRTEIRKVFHATTTDEKILYKDVVSMYPYNQLSNDYPVGTPIIHIYEHRYYPCNIHWKDPIMFPCKCSLEKKMKYKRKQLDIDFCTYEPSQHFIQNFFGFICCNVEPPKDLYHPILVHFDEVRKKCLASNEPHALGVYTSIEIQKFIQYGGKVSNVVRIDEYRKAESKWKNLGKDLYFKKMVNSSKAPENLNERQRLERIYFERFGLDLRNRWDEFDKRPALKAVFKIWNNCGWGKQAETVDHPQMFIHAHGYNDQENSDFFDKAAKNQITCKGFGTLDEGANYFQYMDNRSQVRPDFSRQYLPCAVFVTAYSRLQLWEELNKLGERVLMHDTDSIIYIGKPGLYDIPSGNILGEWEEEDVSKKGIVEFVGLGPKSYGLKFADGTATFKIKGISAKKATEEFFGYEVMKKLILGQQEQALVPQMVFDYKFGGDITTRYFAKAIKFQKEDLKGVLGEDYKIRPFGYLVV